MRVRRGLGLGLAPLGASPSALRRTAGLTRVNMYCVVRLLVDIPAGDCDTVRRENDSGSLLSSPAAHQNQVYGPNCLIRPRWLG